MNIVFFGSSQFAVPSLEALLKSGHKVSCVVTQPDQKKGRGLNYEGTVIKDNAKINKCAVYQPAEINSNESVRFLKNLNPDIFVVVSYGKILSQEVLDIPRIFSINIHASLLPKYRGASPINRAIINADKITGISIIKMSAEMDAGEIILQESLAIDDQDTVISLSDKLSKIAAVLLLEALDGINDNQFKLMAQNPSEITFAAKLTKEDGTIDWVRSSTEINNLIKGVLVWPGAYTYYQGKLLKIYKARVTKSPALPAGRQGHKVTRVPGEILSVSREGIVVATGDGEIIIQELQLEGKRLMTVKDFILGNKIKIGDILTPKKIIA